MFAFIKRCQTPLWILSIFLLSLATFWRTFFFGLWKDDFSLIWSSLYNTHYYHGYFNHPGVPLQFFIFSHIFGTNALFWQCVGFILHVIVSILVGLFIESFTKSKKTGFLAGLFFACSYLGLETIYFPSAQPIAVAAIPMLISLVLFIKALEGSRKNLWGFFFFFIISFILDPARIIPLIVLTPLFLFLFPKNKNIIFYKKIAHVLYPILLFCMVGLLVWWFNNFSLDTLLGKALHEGLISKPSFFLQKLHVFGHYFATIANIFTGLIYGLGQDEQNTGMYSRIFAYLGFVISFLTLGVGIFWIRQKKRPLGIITFFSLWIFLFYLPNWVSEPRAPMAGAHRYIFFSSIGFVGLVSYLLSFIKNKKLFIVAAIVFIFLNIYKANTLLAWQYVSRSNNVITNIWDTINTDVPRNEKNSIFMFFGAQPWVSEDIGLSGAAPFALQRKYFTDPTQMPIITVDIQTITQYLCKSHVRILNLSFTAYKNERVPLSHIHAWDVLPGGKLIDISQKEREILKSMAEKNECVL